MSCIITYKGKKYSDEQFKEYFINNKQEFATSITKNKDVMDSFKRKMEDIDYVFSQSPELASIGTKAQYLQYLSTIFKTSKVKDIVYHGTRNKEKILKEGFKNNSELYLPDDDRAYEAGELGYGYYFTTTQQSAKNYGEPVAVILNNPDITNETTFNLITNEKGIQHFVKNKEQIHILGSKQDIEGFKEFVLDTKRNTFNTLLYAPGTAGYFISNTLSSVVNNMSSLVAQLQDRLHVKVTVVSAEEMKEITGDSTSLGAFVTDSTDTRFPNGIYLTESIQHDKTLTMKVLLHELVHADTSRALYNDTALASEVKQLMAKTKALVGNKYNDLYGFTNEHEFLAEALSDGDFQALLKAAKYNKTTTLWEKFLDILSTLFGISKNNRAVFDDVIELYPRIAGRRQQLDAEAAAFKEAVLAKYGQAESDIIQSPNLITKGIYALAVNEVYLRDKKLRHWYLEIVNEYEETRSLQKVKAKIREANKFLGEEVFRWENSRLSINVNYSTPLAYVGPKAKSTYNTESEYINSVRSISTYKKIKEVSISVLKRKLARLSNMPDSNVYVANIRYILDAFDQALDLDAFERLSDYLETSTASILRNIEEVEALPDNTEDQYVAKLQKLHNYLKLVESLSYFTKYNTEGLGNTGNALTDETELAVKDRLDKMNTEYGNKLALIERKLKNSAQDTLAKLYRKVNSDPTLSGLSVQEFKNILFDGVDDINIVTAALQTIKDSKDPLIALATRLHSIYQDRAILENNMMQIKWREALEKVSHYGALSTWFFTRAGEIRREEIIKNGIPEQLAFLATYDSIMKYANSSFKSKTNEVLKGRKIPFFTKDTAGYLEELKQIFDVQSKKGETLYDELGRKFSYLKAQNIYYSTDKVRELDLDLEKNMETFIANMSQINAKHEIKDALLLTSTLMHDRQIYVTDTLGKRVKNTQINKDSTRAKYYDAWLERVFFDSLEDTKILGTNISAEEIVKKFNRFHSLLGMGFNFTANIINVFQNEWAAIVEATAGEFISLSDYKAGFTTLSKELVGRIAASIDKTHTSKLKAVEEMMNIFQNSSELEAAFKNKGTLLSKGFRKLESLMFAAGELGDWATQTKMLLAMMHGYTVMKNGVEMSLWDAVEIKQGKAFIPAGITKKDGSSFTAKDFSNFRQRVIAANQNMTGVYSAEDKPAISAYWWGMLLLKFRNWMYKGFDRRWTLNRNNKYNQRRMGKEEGMYITLGRYIRNVFKNQGNIYERARLSWDSLDEHEQANLRRVLMELGLVMSLGILLAAMGDPEDDDDKTLLYLMTRVQTENLFWIPPFSVSEGLKIVKAPAAGVTTVSDAMQLAEDVFFWPFMSDEDKLLESGPYKGESKLYKDLMKLTPVIRQFKRDYGAEYRNLSK